MGGLYALNQEEFELEEMQHFVFDRGLKTSATDVLTKEGTLSGSKRRKLLLGSPTVNRKSPFKVSWKDLKEPESKLNFFIMELESKKLEFKGLSALLEELASTGTEVKNVDVRQVLRPKLAKLLSIIYDLMQANYTYNESIDAVTNMGPPLLSQTGEYPDFVERTPDDENDEDYLPTDEEECEDTSESEE
ncbi:hypothetical protein L7F22_046866 [Adiantum nelumboides]|nr:hypothetical protein [Adiantum nelumboides]